MWRLEPSMYRFHPRWTFRVWIAHNFVSCEHSWGMGVSGTFISFVDPISFDEDEG